MNFSIKQYLNKRCKCEVPSPVEVTVADYHKKMKGYDEPVIVMSSKYRIGCNKCSGIINYRKLPPNKGRKGL